MFKAIFAFFTAVALTVPAPEVKVAGALRNIMMDGDLSAHINLDTLNKIHLYGLGPVAGLRGELVVMDGKVYSSSKSDKALVNRQNKTSLAAMLVYSNVKKWQAIDLKTKIKNYAALEILIKQTANKNGYDLEKPFAFRIKAAPQKVLFHVIDWMKGIEHTMDNHKQFSYNDSFTRKPVELLGFYSANHKSIFTHHSTNMHIHVLEPASKTVGHLDDLQISDSITIYLPQL